MERKGPFAARLVVLDALLELFFLLLVFAADVLLAVAEAPIEGVGGGLERLGDALVGELARLALARARKAGAEPVPVPVVDPAKQPVK